MAKVSGYKDKFDAVIAECQREFNDLLLDISSKATDMKNINESAKQKFDDIAEQIRNIKEAHTKIFEAGSENELNVIGDIEDSHIKINKWHDEIEKVRRAILGYHRAVKGAPITPQAAATMQQSAYIEEDGKYYEKKMEQIPGLIPTVENKIEALDLRLEKLEGRVESFFSNKESLFTDKFKDLSKDSDAIKRKIRELLPESMAAGHAAAYYAAKQTHRNRIFLWSGFFIGSMAGIFLTALFLTPAKGDIPLSGWEPLLWRLLHILPFEIPFIWLALLSGKKVNEHSRLYEEYLHKWSVSRTFVGMLDSAKDIDTTNESAVADLYAHVLNSYAFNPSLMLDKKTSSNTPLEGVKESIIEPIKEVVAEVKDILPGKASGKDLAN